MVWGRIKNAIGLGDPLDSLPDGPTRLPDYFPLEPKGCEKQSQKLFKCLSGEATDKARDMERVGFHKSYFPDVKVGPMDPKAAEAVAQDPENPDFPKAGDNPLDECRMFIANYMKCSDRALGQKRNRLLQETVRVQDEYRYQGPTTSNTEE
mmetsp:Transcript_24984/g.54778  ORF Transcript_24984/g.54778 Transcript_24984/m.54778 type:complete len:151 (-) Transcript_24984:277-729(-)|eukprot:CAMPEP_0168194754 /NCGR_PEP_ID=MMETSP0139_2-20121125/19423_1 /TAXON_ID=44445 /ORGANISM="Pseudo-nitzschia australis, Strain 10249 10 AB" /LENGTH=150 /DNA_ID=CAMNT_0008118427 /DNA_START=143 /DNA_END=595 /DNA_ORIENTATION=+